MNVNMEGKDLPGKYIRNLEEQGHGVNQVRKGHLRDRQKEKTGGVKGGRVLLYD